MVLTPEEQEGIRTAIKEKCPKDYRITGKLWTLGRTRQYIEKRFEKAVNERTLSGYMKRWGMSCIVQRSVHRSRIVQVSKGGKEGIIQQFQGVRKQKMRLSIGQMRQL